MITREIRIADEGILLQEFETQIRTCRHFGPMRRFEALLIRQFPRISKKSTQSTTDTLRAPQCDSITDKSLLSVKSRRSHGRLRIPAPEFVFRSFPLKGRGGTLIVQRSTVQLIGPKFRVQRRYRHCRHKTTRIQVAKGTWRLSTSDRPVFQQYFSWTGHLMMGPCSAATFDLIPVQTHKIA